MCGCRAAHDGQPMMNSKIQETILREYSRLRRSEQSLLFFINNVPPSISGSAESISQMSCRSRSKSSATSIRIICSVSFAGLYLHAACSQVLLLADSTHLTEALYNLLTNGYEATVASGRPDRKVALAVFFQFFLILLGLRQLLFQFFVGDPRREKLVLDAVQPDSGLSALYNGIYVV
mgnify:CR=1 FL=1